MSDLDKALDELYAESPQGFTKKRDELVRALESAEDKAALKARRRPTQVAYVLNQLSRRHPDDVAELVDVGRELARAQRKALREEGASGLREAIARQREVVSRLTQKTAALMGELGITSAGHLDEIAGALQAALVDPRVGAALEEGRLEKVPEPTVGFGEATPDLHVVPPPAKTREVERGRVDERAAKARAREEARIAKERAKEEARAARQRARAEARALKDRAKAEAREATAEAERLDAKAKELERAAKEARREAERAKAHARALARRA